MINKQHNLKFVEIMTSNPVGKWPEVKSYNNQTPMKKVEWCMVKIVEKFSNAFTYTVQDKCTFHVCVVEISREWGASMMKETEFLGDCHQSNLSTTSQKMLYSFLHELVVVCFLCNEMCWNFLDRNNEFIHFL